MKHLPWLFCFTFTFALTACDTNQRDLVQHQPQQCVSDMQCSKSTICVRSQCVAPEKHPIIPSTAQYTPPIQHFQPTSINADKLVP